MFNSPLRELSRGSIWDLFRSQLPLLTITDPRAVTEMVRSLIDTYRHLGWLPDCRMSLNKGYTQVSITPQSTLLATADVCQGGSNADVVLADAYLKGLREGINVSHSRLNTAKDKR